MSGWICHLRKPVRQEPYARAMRIFRRRSIGTSKEAALAEARNATAKMRREKANAERYRARKQANPADQMTTNQWIAGGS